VVKPISSVSDENQKLLDVAVIVRNAFQSIDFSETFSLSRFPTDTCDLVSKVLGAILVLKGFKDVKIFRGSVTGGANHRWLLISGITVDITADQFEGLAPVIVTGNPSWETHIFGTEYMSIDEVYMANFKEDPQQQFSREICDKVMRFMSLHCDHCR
jgi:hypothetical protein